MLDSLFGSAAPQIASVSSYSDFVLRLGVDLIVAFVVVRLIYYPRHRNKDFFFTFFLFNVVIFLICYLLSTTTLNVSFAFGLFAIFSILRYRTVTVPVREMGYFFVCLTLGLINALARLDNTLGISILAASNVLIVVILYVLDRHLSLKHENSKQIVYDRIDLITPNKHDEMLEDLRTRTGLPVHRIEIVKVDFLHDVVRLYAFYFSENSDSVSEDAPDDD